MDEDEEGEELYQVIKSRGGYYIAAKPEPGSEMPLPPPGVYELGRDMDRGIYFSPVEFSGDKMVEIPDPAADAIYADIHRFRQAKTRELYDQHQFVYKRGILLYGQPGTGKTTAIMKIARQCVEQGMIVLYNPNPTYVSAVAGNLPSLERGGVCVIWEEFDDVVNGDEHDVLQMLDGAVSLNNAIYLATTNYIERLPDRIVYRPSRFARVIEIGAPIEEARRIYIREKFGAELRPPLTLDAAVAATDGMLLDEIKDVMLSVMFYEMSLPDAINCVRRASNRPQPGRVVRGLEIVNALSELLTTGANGKVEPKKIEVKMAAHDDDEDDDDEA